MQDSFLHTVQQLTDTKQLFAAGCSARLTDGLLYTSTGPLHGSPNTAGLLSGTVNNRQLRDDRCVRALINVTAPARTKTPAIINRQ